MTTEHYSLSSFVTDFQNPEMSIVPQGYYRSKLFVVPTSTNTLVAAAGPVLSLLERLCLSHALPPIAEIHDNIKHELRAFYSKLHAAQHPLEVINTGYYLLAVTVDEILGKNYLRIYTKAPQFKAFTPLTKDDTPPQKRFFDILNYIKQQPNQYLDLLELIYFCLVAGFEGEFHAQAAGRQTLDNHIESLYQIIQQHRFNKPHRLFNENNFPKIIKRSYYLTYLTLFITIGVVTAAFLTSQFLLEKKAKTVLFAHSQLAQLDD